MVASTPTKGAWTLVTFFNTEPIIQKARKPHQCDWCCEKIQIGEIYHRRMCAYEGSGSTIKQHPECAAAENRYYVETRETEWDLHAFTRGCTCEAGDRGHGHGHGTYPTCFKKEQPNEETKTTPAQGD